VLHPGPPSHQVAAKELHALLTKPSLEGIPLLVLGNKNDLPGALDTQAVIAQMELQVRAC
jgi:ADP-ribosylation factor-like protein 8